MKNKTRLDQQIAFMKTSERLKSVERRTWTLDGSRRENSAEHSWSLALLAMLLGEHGPDGVDINRVIRMALIHDLIEIFAGDTYAYDDESLAGQAKREAKAAKRLFGLLPDDQASEWASLWEEFEQRKTPESLFAKALDHFHPCFLNDFSGGKSWQEHGVTLERVLKRNFPMKDGSMELWQATLDMLEEAVRKKRLEE